MPSADEELDTKKVLNHFVRALLGVWGGVKTLSEEKGTRELWRERKGIVF